MYQTRSHAPATAAHSPTQSESTTQALPKATHSPSLLGQIAESLTHIINVNKINATVKRNVEAIIQFTLKAEKEGKLE